MGNETVLLVVNDDVVRTLAERNHGDTYRCLLTSLTGLQDELEG